MDNPSTRHTLLGAHALLIVLAAALSAGCLRRQSEFAEAVPHRDALAINAHDDACGTAGRACSALIGERAKLYIVTRDVSRAVNGGVAAVLIVLGAIVSQPPTTQDETHAVWGPFTPTLSPVTYRLIVTRVSAGEFDYVLQGRSRTSISDGDFVNLLGGHSHLERGVGIRGQLALDFDTAHALDAEEFRSTGAIGVNYDTIAEPRLVEVAFANVVGPLGGPAVTAGYRYTEARDQTGTFLFAASADLNGNGTAENLLVASRWLSSGAGRGDIAASGADLGAGVVVAATECWDDGFGRTYYADNGGFAPTEGDAASCVFTARLEPVDPLTSM